MNGSEEIRMKSENIRFGKLTEYPLRIYVYKQIDKYSIIEL